MTTTKHTPGPWKQGDACFSDMRSIRSNGHRIAVADGGISTSDAEDHANARLIAAAPDLLEALESLYHAANSIGEDTCDPVAFAGALEDARASIAKARGQE